MSLLLTAATSTTTTATPATTIASTVTTVANAAGGTAKTVSAGSLLFQMVVGLAVVLGIIWIAARVLRGRAGGITAKRRNAPLAVLGRQPMGKGVQLAIVKAGADTYLLGITAHQVTNLGRFEPEDVGLESPDDLPPAVATTQRSPAASPFPFQSPLRALQDRTLRKG